MLAQPYKGYVSCKRPTTGISSQLYKASPLFLVFTVTVAVLLWSVFCKDVLENIKYIWLFYQLEALVNSYCISFIEL